MRRTFFFLLTFIVITIPIFALAAGLVPCEGSGCRACDLVTLAQNVLRWIIGIMASVIALVFAFGGFKMIMAAGDTGAVSSAKQMMTNAVIGFVILLAGWLIVDTVLKQFVGDRLGRPWSQVECIAPPPPTTPPPTTTPPPSTGTTGCSTQCAPIPQGITIKDRACSGSGPCTVSSEIVDELTRLDLNLDNVNIQWQVTEGFPPTVVHSESCHARGTCIDANFTGNTQPTSANIQAFINNASMSGARAIWEVKTQAQKDALVSGGVSASNIAVVGHITAPHFSVYMCGNDPSPKACPK